MNICFIVDYYPPDRLGGIGEAARYLKAELEKSGHTIVVITTGTKSNDNKLEKNVIRITKHLTLFSIIIFFRLPWIIKKKSIDVIHNHHSIGFTAFFWKLLYPSHFPPLISTFQCCRTSIAASIKPLYYDDRKITGPTPREYITKCTFTLLSFADKYAGILSDHCTACSVDTAEENMAKLRISRSKMTPVHNGVDSILFNPSVDNSIIRKKYNIHNDEIMLLYAGSFSIRKRVPLLLCIMRSLIRENMKCKLVITGSGKGYEKHLLTLIKDFRLEESAFLSGFVRNSELPFYYAAADICLFPSEYEPFGIVVAEAMAMAKPVIASAVNGIKEIVEDGKTGYLVQKDNSKHFIEKILELSTDKQKALRMGIAGRERVEEMFTWEKIAKDYMKQYIDITRNRNE